MAKKANPHLIAILSLFALSSCAFVAPNPTARIDANAAVLGREAGRTASTGESVDADAEVREAAIRLGLTGRDLIRFKAIFWEQYQRGYYGAGPYRMTPGGGAL